MPLNYLINFLGGLKISTKLQIGLGTILMIGVGIGMQSIYSARSQSQLIKQMFEQDVKGISYVKEAQVHLMEVGRSLRQLILSPNKVSQQVAYIKLTEARAVLRYSLQEADPLLKEEVGRRLLSDTHDMVNQYFTEVEKILALILSGNQARKLPSDEVSRRLASPENVHVFTAVDQLMVELVKHQELQAQKHSEAATQFTSRLEVTIVIWLFSGLMLGLFVSTGVALSVRRPTERLRQTVVKLASGQFDIQVPHSEYQNEIGDMSRALISLQTVAQKAAIRQWVETRSATLAVRLQAFGDMDVFLQELMPMLVPLVGAEIGLLFTRNDVGDSFRFKSGMGVFNPADLIHQYQAGEGLVGRCASEGAPIQVTGLTESVARIHSGSIDSSCSHVGLFPVKNSEGAVIAVIELASIHPPNEQQIALMLELLPIIGLNLTILDRQRMNAELLMESQILAITLEEQRNALVSQAETLKIQRDELEVARLRAEEATRVKSEFLANMSHEIRTPMNAVIGLSHLALKTDLSAQQQDYLQKIHSEGKSLLSVINDILDFSKMEAGKFQMDDAEFRLDDVLDGASTALAFHASEKGLDFLIRVMPEVPVFLVGDPQRLRQVLVNLASNGIKFTEKGSVIIEVSVVDQGDDRIQLSFSIQDTGIGITKEQLAKLFTAFTQADASTTRRFGGTGLGLVISKRIVEMMDGSIQVTSESDKGSTFSFTAMFGVSHRQPERTVPKAGCTPLKVLVVDDSFIARSILNEQLLTMGIAVVTAATAREGLATLHAADTHAPFDVVLMDWRMPEMDGVKAAEIIHHDQALLHKPAVVLITAFGLTDVREAAVNAGISAFLDKPVSQSRLWDTLARFQREGVKREAEVFAHTSTMDQLSGIKVLLVEDNEINQQIATELMVSMGVDVTVARNGQEALDMLASSTDPVPWSVVLMDMQMPVMDGHQATIALRQQARFQALPILAMTAHAMADEVSRCLAEGINQHLTKPIDPQTLYDALAHWGARAIGKKTPGGPTVSQRTVANVTPPECKLVIPLVDVHRGLSQCGGNEEIYRSILRKFVRMMGDIPDQIKTMLTAAELEEARRLAHTLKGVSGNIGAIHCYDLSKSLESELEHAGHSAKSEVFLTQLALHLPELMAEIAKAIPLESPSAGGDTSFNAAMGDVKRVFAELADKLTGSYSDAEMYLHEHEALVRHLLGDEVEHLKAEIEAFDYELALIRLNRHLP